MVVERIEPQELEKFGSLDAVLRSAECSWDCLSLSKPHTQDNTGFQGAGPAAEAGFDLDGGAHKAYHCTQFMKSTGQWNPHSSTPRQSPQSQGIPERTLLENDSCVHQKPGSVIVSQTACSLEPGQDTTMHLEEGLPVCCMVPSSTPAEAPKVSIPNVHNMGLTNPEYVAFPTQPSHPFGGSALLPGRNDHPRFGSYLETDQTVGGLLPGVHYSALHMNGEPSSQPPFQSWGKLTPTCAAITESVPGVSHFHKEINDNDSTKQNCPQTESAEMGSEVSKLAAVIASGGEEKWIAKFGKSSPYIGVTKHRKSNRWEAHIWIKDYGRQLYLGGFSTAEEAACAYDLVAIKCKGVKATTNSRSERYSPLMLSRGKQRSKGFSRGNSMYRGVTQHPNGRWESRIGISGNRHIYLGLYEKQEDAASHYDRALVRMRGWRATTNFPFSEYQSELEEHKLLEEGGKAIQKLSVHDLMGPYDFYTSKYQRISDTLLKFIFQKLMDDAEEIECESDPILRKVYGLWVKKGGRDPLERLIVRIRESEEPSRNDEKAGSNA
ncbi:hypothetical protein BSKO_02837 [Bryopsis sp. KO-2023]|nr:hypothetical protein BSKO_02837 [Bryopsis sp. KO-2023]